MTREDVINWLEYLSDDARSKADSLVPTNIEIACRMAIEALKARESRVMTLDELRMHEVYWAEQENVSRPWPIAMHHIRIAGLLDGPVYQDYMGDNFNAKEYGKTWRCWTARPTKEQMEAVKWNA